MVVGIDLMVHWVQGQHLCNIFGLFCSEDGCYSFNCYFKGGGNKNEETHPAALLLLSLTSAVTCGPEERIRDGLVTPQYLPTHLCSPRSGMVRSRCHEFFLCLLLIHICQFFFKKTSPAHGAINSKPLIYSHHSLVHILWTLIRWNVSDVLLNNFSWSFSICILLRVVFLYI